ncbi:MAG: hypothetical protein QM496_14715 [Verrucomicrobiota bacterium]
MSVVEVILIALAGALGLALAVGVAGWIMSRGAEVAADSVDFDKEENGQLFPKWIFWVYIFSYSILLLLQYALTDFLDFPHSGGHYPMIGTMWIQFALGLFRYGLIVKRRRGSVPFRRLAFYLLCGSVAGLLLSTWQLFGLF